MPLSNSPQNQVSVTLANRGGQTLHVDRRRPLLNTLEAQGISLPYGCRYGGCISCAAKLLSGEVDQRAGVALNSRQLKQGFVLLCVARPLSDCTLEIGVESHEGLYRNPFKNPTAMERQLAGSLLGPAAETKP